MSPLLMAPYKNDADVTSLGKINSFAITCEFLDSLRTSANVSGGTYKYTVSKSVKMINNLARGVCYYSQLTASSQLLYSCIAIRPSDEQCLTGLSAYES